MIACRIERERRLVVVEYSGESSFDEWRAAMLDVFADPLYAPGFGVLLDRRTVEPPTTQWVDQAVAFWTQQASQLATTRIALVVGSVAGYGMGRMTQTRLTERVNMGVFTDVEEARGWLSETDGGQL